MKKKKDEFNIAKILILVTLAAILFIVFVVASIINNSKNSVTNDASNLIKNQKTEETDTSAQNKEDANSEIKNEEKIETEVENIVKSGKEIDPFYPQILEQLKSQKSIGYIDVKNDYTPKENYVKNAATEKGKIRVFKKMPIMIYVPKGEYYDPITQAFVAYNNQFKGVLSFKATNDPYQSDIKIVMTNDLSDSNDGENVVGVGGPRKFDREGNIKYSELKILNKSLYKKDEKPSLIYVYNTALHEIGHCIGIAGHSSQANDVMFEHLTNDDINKIKPFSQRDIETITLMYSGRDDLLDKELENVKDEKLEENIKYAQSHNNSDSYLSVADSYYNMEQYDKALEAYKKALSLNPENYRIYLNLSYCYEKSKQYDNALDFSKKALEKASTDDQKAMSNINTALILSKQENYKDAAPYYKAALTLKPEIPEYFVSYIINCFRLNDKAEAKKIYKEYGKNYNFDNFTKDEKVILEWLKK